MKLIFQTVLGGSMGFFMASLGYNLTTWQFWVACSLLLAMQLSPLLED